MNYVLTDAMPAFCKRTQLDGTWERSLIIFDNGGYNSESCSLK